MHIASIGIDLGKTTFHLVALGEQNKVLLRKKFSRPQLLAYTANLPAALIGLEACAGAYFVGTALREQGHEVRLIPAQFVKPYRKSNKNDFIDGEAIAEAVTKQNMRFAQLKTQEQLDWQAMHGVRDRLVRRRTALINEIRGFLLERGITFAAQPIHLRKICYSTRGLYWTAILEQPVVQVRIREQKVLRYPQAEFVESAHGDGDAQAAGEARRFVDRACGVSIGSGAQRGTAHGKES